jgi:hypothetical protein
MTALADLKLQLSMTDDDLVDDAFLETLLADALSHTGDAIGTTSPLTYADLAGGLRRAVLMLAAHFYENREAVLVGITANEMPLGFWELIEPHRRWVF